MKTELLNGILNVVSEVCEIPTDQILSKCKQNDVVNARCIFVHFCIIRYGIPAITVLEFINRKRTSVISAYLQNYDIFRSQSYSFRLFCYNVADKLSAIYPETTR